MSMAKVNLYFFVLREKADRCRILEKKPAKELIYHFPFTITTHLDKMKSKDW